jgi:hypothetical protein
MAALEKDLQQFGVFQKGYSETPSDLVQLVCFERDTKCVYRPVQSKTTPKNQMQSGVILAIEHDDVRIGLDFSNDIVTSKSNQIKTLFDRLTSSGDFHPGSHLTVGCDVKVKQKGKDKFASGKIIRDHGDNTYEICYENGDRELRVHEDLIEILPDKTPKSSRVPISSVGSHVLFHDEAKPSIESRYTNEILFISAEQRRDSTPAGVSPNYLFPVVIGRSSMPVPANMADMPLASDDFFRLEFSFLYNFQNLLGKSSAHFLSLDRARSSYHNCFKVQRAEIVSSAFSSSSSTSQSIASLLSFLGHKHYTTKLTYCTLLWKLKEKGATISHPFIRYLNDYLNDIFKTPKDIDSAIEKW